METNIEVAETLSEAQAKDEILKHLIKNPKSDFSATDILKDVFPELNEDLCRLLIKRIANSTDDIVETYDAFEPYISIRANGLTKSFLKQGGYSFLEEQENSMIKEEELDKRIKELTLENLELSNKHKKRYILYSIAGFVSGAIITNIRDIIRLIEYFKDFF